MFRRVGLIVLAFFIQGILTRLGVPGPLALILGFLPWGIAETFGRGPYQKSGHEIMNEPNRDPTDAADDEHSRR